MTSPTPQTPDALTEHREGVSYYARDITVTADDWWALIDTNAALAERYPPLEVVHKERPGGPLARRLDADHENRKLARRNDIAAHRERREMETVEQEIAAYRERARLRRTA